MSRSVSSNVGSPTVSFNETLIPDVSKLKTEPTDEPGQHFSQVLQGQENANQSLSFNLRNHLASLAQVSSSPVNQAAPSLMPSGLPGSGSPQPEKDNAPTLDSLPSNLALNYYQQFQSKIAQPPATASTRSETHNAEATGNADISAQQDTETSGSESAPADITQMMKMAAFSPVQIFASQLQTSPAVRESSEEKEEPALGNQPSEAQVEESPLVAQRSSLAIISNPVSILKQASPQQTLATASQTGPALAQPAGNRLQAMSPSADFEPGLASSTSKAGLQETELQQSAEPPIQTPVIAKAAVAPLVPNAASALSSDLNSPVVKPQSQAPTSNVTSSFSKQKTPVPSAPSPDSGSALMGTYTNSNWAAMNMSLSFHTTLAKSQPSSPDSVSVTPLKSSAKEKLSSAPSVQETFFLSNSTANSVVENAAQLMGGNNQTAAQMSASQSVHSQAVTVASQTTAQNLVAQHTGSTSSLGTARANEKSVTAKVESDLSGNAMNLPTLTSVNISKTQILSHNGEFHGVMRQVVNHVQSDPSITVLSPRRVSVEIQTPPGAIVNVYISRQNDQFRAQLSTADPQALKWVQDQVSALQQSPETGRSVQWLPAQMEGQTNDSASGQGNRQDPPTQDERNPQRNVPQETSDDDLMTNNKKAKGSK